MSTMPPKNADLLYWLLMDFAYFHYIDLRELTHVITVIPKLAIFLYTFFQLCVNEIIHAVNYFLPCLAISIF